MKLWTLNDFKKIEQNEGELYASLYDAAYNNMTADLGIFEHYLNDQRSDISRIALHCILYIFKSTESKFIEYAKSVISNVNESEELIVTAISGLGEALFNSKNSDIIKLLYGTYTMTSSPWIKLNCFKSILKLLGISMKDLTLKNGKVINEYDDLDLDKLGAELHLFDQFISQIE